MIVSKWLVEKLMGQSDKANDANAAMFQKSLAIALEAKQAEVNAVVAAKDEQIEFLKVQIAELTNLVNHERSRAEAAIDQILNFSKAAAVSNADLARTATEKEIEKLSKEDRVKEVSKIFDDVNESMGTVV